MRSKGKPHTWTQIGICVKLTVLAVMPFSHRRRARIWLSKHQGPLFQTHDSWLSIENLNCKSLSSTSTIFRSSPNFHIDRSKFFAALRLMDLVVRNCPMRLNEYSSRISCLRTGCTIIASSSSIVNFIHWIRSKNSKSILALLWLKQLEGPQLFHPLDKPRKKEKKELTRSEKKSS